jgi:uncharacterized membrane protein (UPF0127 family)
MKFLKNRKVWIVILLLVAVAAAMVFSFSRTSWRSAVVLSGKTFSVEVADTQYLLEKGLSGHAPLASNEGMLFIFQTPDTYGFWMKDMLFPLDIIWIGSDLRIVSIEKSLSPDTYPQVFYPVSPALYVLEIPAGESDALHLKIGDSVQFAKKWL